MGNLRLTMRFQSKTSHEETRKPNKQSIDQSVDNSTQIAGNQYNNDSHNTVYVGEVATADLVVSAYWNYIVPYHIVKEQGNIGPINVLQPVDSTFRRATFSVKLIETYDERNANTKQITKRQHQTHLGQPATRFPL